MRKTISRKAFTPLTGFTLIEILVVISIIGLLTSVATVNYVQYLSKERDSKRRQDLEAIRTVLESYKFVNNNYPQSYPTLPNPLDADDWEWIGDCDSSRFKGRLILMIPPGTFAPGKFYIPSVVPQFVDRLPIDPKFRPADLETRCYAYRSNGAIYKAIAHLSVENSLDPTSSDPIPNTDPMNDPNSSRSNSPTFAVWSEGADNY